MRQRFIISTDKRHTSVRKLIHHKYVCTYMYGHKVYEAALSHLQGKKITVVGESHPPQKSI